MAGAGPIVTSVSSRRVRLQARRIVGQVAQGLLVQNQFLEFIIHSSKPPHLKAIVSYILNDCDQKD